MCTLPYTHTDTHIDTHTLIRGGIFIEPFVNIRVVFIGGLNNLTGAVFVNGIK
jgi:hypothetical protein